MPCMHTGYNCIHTGNNGVSLKEGYRPTQQQFP